MARPSLQDTEFWPVLTQPPLTVIRPFPPDVFPDRIGETGTLDKDSLGLLGPSILGF